MYFHFRQAQESRSIGLKWLKGCDAALTGQQHSTYPRGVYQYRKKHSYLGVFLRVLVGLAAVVSALVVMLRDVQTTHHRENA